MIASLQEWAMVLSGVAVFGSLCEVILPEGSFQKYIRLGLGMVLVLAMLSPVRELLHQEWRVAEESGQRRAYQDAEAMEERQREDVIRIYQENLNQQMLASLEAKISGFSGSVSCSVETEQENFGVIRKVLILSDIEEVDRGEILRILREEFGVASEQITIRF